MLQDCRSFLCRINMVALITLKAVYKFSGLSTCLNPQNFSQSGGLSPPHGRQATTFFFPGKFTLSTLPRYNTLAKTSL